MANHIIQSGCKTVKSDNLNLFDININYNFIKKYHFKILI